MRQKLLVPKIILLVGMMGAGKTSVGRIVAKKLGLPFIDSDKEIEKITGFSISDLFARYGEKEFRIGEEKIMERLPLTVGMNVISLLLTLLISIPIGIVSAVRRGSALDRILTVLVFLGFAMPSFWLAMLLMLYFGIDLGWLPLSGITSLDYAQLSPLGKVLDISKHLVLPILVGLVGSIAGTSRFLRSSMLEVLRQDYMTTARAKGLPPGQVIGRHALRNALLPVITMLGLSVPGLIGGSVIVETIFALPGLGQLFYTAVMARDYPLIMGNLVLGAVLTLLGNMLADAGYSLADPRIRATADREEKA